MPKFDVFSQERLRFDMISDHVEAIQEILDGEQQGPHTSFAITLSAGPELSCFDIFTWDGDDTIVRKVYNALTKRAEEDGVKGVDLNV